MVKFEFKVQGAKHVKAKFLNLANVQAPNEKTSNIKVIDLFKKIKMDLNFASFGFLMKELWALEVGLF